VESTLGKSINQRLKSVQMNDVNSHSLGVKISDPENRARKVNHIMIPKNTQIPFKISQRFVTNTANQQTIHVNILEGDARDPDACTLIGDFRIVNLPANMPSGSPVEVTYEYDKNGRIHATAKELTGNRQASTEIVRDSGVNEQEVDVLTTLAGSYAVE
jgi:molecular chaperone DnaK